MKIPTNILIIEDDRITREILSAYLSGYEHVVSVKGGKDGIKECKSDSYDLILMDIKSKNGIDGVQTLKEIRKIDKYRHIPILAVTGCAMPGDKEHILQEGFNGYLAKPFIKKTFMDFVKKYLPKS